MSDDTKFLDGMIVKKKRDTAPDFVKCHLSFNVAEVIETLQKYERNGWVNADINVSKAGKLYAKVDDWEPQQQAAPEPPPTDDFGGIDDSIPFAPFCKGEV